MKEEYIRAISEIRRAIEKHCIYLNTDLLRELNNDERQLEDFLNLLRNDKEENPYREFLKSLKRKSIKDTENVMDALSELNFHEHLQLFKKLSIKDDSWEESSNNIHRDFEDAAQVIYKWRNEIDTHTKTNPKVDESQWPQVLKSVKIIGNVLNKDYTDWIKKNTNFTSQTLTNMPIPDFKSDGIGFFGRRKEQQRIKRLLKNSSTVSISGSGGLGKTALAQKVILDLIDNEEYTHIVWFSSKLDVMRPKGIAKESRYNSSIQELLLRVVSVIDNATNLDHYNDDESWTLEELLEYLKDSFLSHYKMLIVIDNFETLNEVNTKEDYKLLLSYIKGDEYLIGEQLSKNIRWLITSRNSIDFAIDERLTELEDSAADKLLINSMNQLGNIPIHLVKKAKGRPYRKQWLSKLHNYPLYIKMFCGWLNLGLSVENELNESVQISELEEFCFRNTLDILVKGDKQTHLLTLLIIAEDFDLSFLSKNEILDFFTWTINEYDDTISMLKSVCVIVDSLEGDGPRIAPALSGYITRNLNQETIDINEIKTKVKELKDVRKVKTKFLGKNFNGQNREDLKKAIRILSQLKKTKQADIFDIENSAKNNNFNNQIKMIIRVKQNHKKTIDEVNKMLNLVKQEIRDGACYWDFVKTIWKEIRINHLDNEGEVLLKFGEQIIHSFEDIQEANLYLIQQQIYVYCKSKNTEKVYEALQELLRIRKHETRNLNKAEWKKTLKYCMTQLAQNKIVLDKHAQVYISEFLQILAMGPKWEIDMVWSSQILPYMSHLKIANWNFWIRECTSDFHDKGNYDTSQTFNSFTIDI